MDIAHGRDFEGPSVDPAFARALRALDPKLRVRWNPNIERHQIGRLVPSSRLVSDLHGIPIHDCRERFFPLFHVTNEDGSFRPLGMRAIAQLGMMDMWAGGGLKHYKRRLNDELVAQEQRAEAEQEYEAECLGGEIADYMSSLPQKKRWW